MQVSLRVTDSPCLAGALPHTAVRTIVRRFRLVRRESARSRRECGYTRPPAPDEAAVSDLRRNPPTTHRTVSSEHEALILVDSADRELGSLPKAECHDGEGVLHRAFSAFIFNSRGELLIQRRAPDKRLWPGSWSNSCCSHPRSGEAMADAVNRRLDEELGFAPGVLAPSFVYKFEYHARYGDAGSERELCWVYVAHAAPDPVVNTAEIAGWRWIAPAELDRQLASESLFTPWFQLEWQRLRTDYPSALDPA
jgi:isopentenyl-diphosphate delta-isomerase